MHYRLSASRNQSLTCVFVCVDLQSWNLVGARWWQQWCQYAGMNTLNGTPHGSLPLPNIPDHARVQVEALDTNTIISRSSSISVAFEASPRPGPIANWALLMRSGSRRLKEKLVFSRDFYVSSV